MAQLILANAIVAVVAVPAFWLLLGSVRLVRNRRHTGSARARGDRLAIYVAWIDGDDACGTARHRIMTSLRHEIGRDTVEVLPAGLRPRWHDDLGFDAVKTATEREAHRLLQRKGGHLLIWGRLDHLDGSSVLELNFTSPDTAVTEGSYSFADKLRLDAAFGPEAGAALWPRSRRRWRRRRWKMSASSPTGCGHWPTGCVRWRNTRRRRCDRMTAAGFISATRCCGRRLATNPANPTSLRKRWLPVAQR